MPAVNVRVLVVDDEPDVCQYLSALLNGAGIPSAIAVDGQQAIEQLKAHPPGWFGLVLLDVAMPRKNGWEFLDELRQAGDEVPVIFVSARDTSEERVRGLRLGADDFVVKPFLFDELLARMEAVLRRRRSLAPIVVGALKLDLSRRKTEREGKPIDLSPREFDLLLALALRVGEVVSKRTLLAEVWRQAEGGSDRTVDVHLSWLRRKLGETAAEPRYLESVRGVGVRMVDPTAQRTRKSS